MSENAEQYYCNIILKNGSRIISEIVESTQKTVVIYRPIEVIKRPITKTNDSGTVLETITMSPYLIMVNDYYMELSREDCITIKDLQEEFVSIYNTRADQYYLDISEVSTHGNGVLH